MSNWNFDMENFPKDEEILIWLGGLYDSPALVKYFEPWDVFIHSSDPIPKEDENTEMYGIGSLVPVAWMRVEKPNMENYNG